MGGLLGGSLGRFRIGRSDVERATWRHDPRRTVGRAQLEPDGEARH
jgi:hypothetical protein